MIHLTPQFPYVISLWWIINRNQWIIVTSANKNQRIIVTWQSHKLDGNICQWTLFNMNNSVTFRLFQPCVYTWNCANWSDYKHGIVTNCCPVPNYCKKRVGEEEGQGIWKVKERTKLQHTAIQMQHYELYPACNSILCK